MQLLRRGTLRWAKVYIGIMITLISLFVLLCTGCALPNQVSNEKPQRVVSMSVTVDQVLLDLVEANRIAALTKLVDEPTLSYEVEKAKAVPNRIDSYTTEEIMKLQPDVVIADSSYQPEVLQSLREVGIKVEVVEVAQNLDQVPTMIAQIAKIVKEEEKGKEIIVQYQKELEQAKTEVKRYPPREVYTYWGDQSYGGKDSFLGDLYRECGMKDILGSMSKREAANLSSEYILQFQPDVIVIGGYQLDPAEKDNLYTAIKKPGVSTLKAVQTNRIATISGAILYSPNQHAPESLRKLAKEIASAYENGRD